MIGPDGVYVGGGAHHNRFQRLDVKNAMHNGFHISNGAGNSPFNEILNCRIHDNGRYPGVNRGYGLYVFTSDNLIDGNEIYSNGGYGLHFFNNSGPLDVSRNIIRNNKIHHNGTHGGTNYGIAVAWGNDNLIYNNLIYSNGGGILVYVKAGNTQIYNNTIYGNQPSEGIMTQYYASAPIIRNNIIYANAGAVVNYGGESGTPITSHNLTADPKFVNASAFDFQLQSNSPAQDAGMTVSKVPADYAGVARPQGTAYDIGAYERSQGPSPPSKPRKLRIVSP